MIDLHAFILVHLDPLRLKPSDKIMENFRYVPYHLCYRTHGNFVACKFCSHSENLNQGNLSVCNNCSNMYSDNVTITFILHVQLNPLLYISHIYRYVFETLLVRSYSVNAKLGTETTIG